MTERHFSRFDRLLMQADVALRTLVSKPRARRASPAARQEELSLTAAEKRLSAALMRVNHSGEICAQALYQGQALTAQKVSIQADMEAAANEEVDHLAWCEQRIQELGSHTSALNPLWYGLSFGIGAGAGAISDRLSLGFVAATEEQVCEHLKGHMNDLPASDSKSRAIVEQMIEDEEAHGVSALRNGGLPFPGPVKSAMGMIAKAMTESSSRF
ncbi:MAG: 2-polyprenyl-3-methyl-6-methoxy-1,4-benzoquinone monooxygenase [Porticoccaceae bacterium]|nr:2-polyprenyl-3-methyl-6-methoxy-1,4-benzoquinone monooxygenase [Porticoccaceae bacterium]